MATNDLWLYEVQELARMFRRGLLTADEIRTHEMATVRMQRKHAMRVCGSFHATRRQLIDAIALRPSALTAPVPQREKPSQKLARLAREAQARRLESWRNAQAKH